MSEIQLKSISKKFSDVLAVDNVSLTINDGEFVTLVGPSGCGKTTTLRMIAGFEVPDRGTIKIDDHDVTDVPPFHRDIGMVFQQFALFPHMTAGENIGYGLKVRGEKSSDEIEARVEEMLELVRLPEVKDRKPENLSGGQQQRIALARALAPEPRVLLLDEPLASLDKKLREEMQIELQRIQNEVNITTVFVTHNQDEAMSMSDRIAVMNEGQFEQVGVPDEVYDKPTSRFVADFIGTSNILEGEVVTIGDGEPTIDCRGFLLKPEELCAQAGDTVDVVVRPENVTIRNSEDANGHSVAGNIEFKRNLGASIEYHVRTEGGNRWISVQPRDQKVDANSSVNISISDFYTLEA